MQHILKDMFHAGYWVHFLLKLDKGRSGCIIKYAVINMMHRTKERQWHIEVRIH